MNLRVLAASAAVIVLVGCKSTPPAPKTAEISNEVVVEAPVTAVDRDTREVTIERENGAQIVIQCGEEVRNFDQIEVGQNVICRYVESLSARLMDEDEPSIEPVAEVAAGRAEEGEQPGIGIAAGVVWDVKVESVDHEQDMVVFTDPAGELRVVKARYDEGKAFVKGLNKGDRVELMVRESVVLTVE